MRVSEQKTTKPVPSKGATQITSKASAAVRSKLSFGNQEDFEDARRGFIATLPDGAVAEAGGKPIWDFAAYDFLREKDASLDTVNPSVWRQGKLNAIHGLFKVTDHIYQVRSFDLSNMIIIEGNTGLQHMSQRFFPGNAQKGGHTNYE